MQLTYSEGFSALRVGWDNATGHVGHLLLNRPDKSNAFNATLWAEFPQAVKLLQERGDVRVLVISAAGKNFCAGLDLSYLSGTFGAKMTAAEQHRRHAQQQQQQHQQAPKQQQWRLLQGHHQQPCPARMRYQFRQDIVGMQVAFSILEECQFSVIAAVHGACVGAGVDLITAADLRYCSKDAYFSVKEVDLAITADLGTLQRLPSIIGHGAAAELALTARNLSGPEALRLGLVSACYDSRDQLLEGVMAIAEEIAAKSPLAVSGTKRVLLHTRDQSGGVAAGLAHVALWNSAYLLSADMEELLKARATGRQPAFSKL